jgi:16S rRNA (uracil1498-N3)-methyltransferase
MPRFYCPCPLEVGSSLVLPDKVAHHIRVLRLGADAVISLFNGEGGEYTAQLLPGEKKQMRAEIKIHHPLEIETPYALTLAQALPEAGKMDWIIEKAVEMGAFGIQPLASQRSVVRLAGERLNKRQDHWRNIIISASEQSGRNRLTYLAELSDFKDWIGQQDLHRRILLSPRAITPLSDWARHHPPQALTLIIGPEGGFTEEEENTAIKHGALAFALGPRVLRTETCGVAALAALNALWNGMCQDPR